MQPNVQPKSKLPDITLTEAEEHIMSAMDEMQRKHFILQKQVKVLREGSLINRGNLRNPDPNYTYTWVNKREDRQIYFEGLGWEKCTNPAIGSNFWKEDEQQHRQADRILYQRDIQLSQLMDTANVVSGLERIDPKTAKAAFESAVAKFGVPVYVPNQKGK